MKLEGKDIRVILNPDGEYCPRADEAQELQREYVLQCLRSGAEHRRLVRIGNAAVNEGHADGVGLPTRARDGRVGSCSRPARIRRPMH